MRVTALYDIHCNLPAREAVLHELEELAVDQVAVGGDVLCGPMQVECLNRLRALPFPLHFIMGDADREVIAARQRKSELTGVRAGARTAPIPNTRSG